MKKDKMRLKGQLGMYMKWPLIMTLLLFAMNIWMYMIDKKAGVMMTVFIAIYLIIASSLYFHNRSTGSCHLQERSHKEVPVLSAVCSQSLYTAQKTGSDPPGSCGRMIALKS